MLAIIGGLIGIFFIPALGRWMDRFGIRKDLATWRHCILLIK